MAIKKSDLYSKLWASCDELRGGMDASQYKDYVLVLLFIKYISDKYAGQPFAPIQIPEGASFANMVALKGKSDIGDQINKKIVRPLEEANRLRIKADFNDDALLGQGKEKVDKLTNLIGIFEHKDLNFSKHRADGDDILGDAYEYLMRHFATESGKSKGQFYTPAEVSRVMAQTLGIAKAPTSPDTTVYDPTCGSGSLLLKVAEAAPTPVSVYGQEKEEVTSGLARMNMILHHNPGAVIEQGNTLADPKFLVANGGDQQLKTFDYVVANPPFSDKRWSNGLVGDTYGRFEGFGTPPDKQGDYAYLLHIIRSLKSTGRAACILPHGVLFRGNAEAEIRKSLVRRGLIQAIIGLPANLFYGTGIPACILVIDKAGAGSGNTARKGIFMIDAAQGYMKDGPKNRLRERDIHRIVDTFSTLDGSDPRYARMVGLDEIEKNDFNLNLPRYIDSSTPEDQQDIDAHLNGGIPQADMQALARYWAVCPQLRAALFKPRRPGYLDLAVAPAAIKPTIHQHPEFQAFTVAMNAHFDQWRASAVARLKSLDKGGFHPKDLIRGAEGLLHHYEHQPTAEKLIDPYAVYQHLMDYWAQTMQDDAYLIAEDGWQATPYRVLETRKNKDGSPGKTVDKGWACDLVPKALLVQHHFAAEQAELDALSAQLESTLAAQAELEEEHSGDEAVFGGFDKINDAAVKSRIKEVGRDADAADELAVLKQWLALSEQASGLKKRIKTLDAALDAKALARYPTLTPDEVKALVVDHKWMAALGAAVHGELDRVSQALTGRVKELAERYGRTIPELAQQVDDLEARVAGHLAKMGFVWK
jgi:type I restriction enzyme M protein